MAAMGGGARAKIAASGGRAKENLSLLALSLKKETAKREPRRLFHPQSKCIMGSSYSVSRTGLHHCSICHFQEPWLGIPPLTLLWESQKLLFSVGRLGVCPSPTKTFNLFQLWQEKQGLRTRGCEKPSPARGNDEMRRLSLPPPQAVLGVLSA